MPFRSTPQRSRRHATILVTRSLSVIAKTSVALLATPLTCPMVILVVSWRITGHVTVRTRGRAAALPRRPALPRNARRRQPSRRLKQLASPTKRCAERVGRGDCSRRAPRLSSHFIAGAGLRCRRVGRGPAGLQMRRRSNEPRQLYVFLSLPPLAPRKLLRHRDSQLTRSLSCRRWL